MSTRLLGLSVFVLSTVVASTAHATFTANPSPLNVGNAIVGDAGGASGSTNIDDPGSPTNLDIVLDSNDADCSAFEITSNATNRTPPFTTTIKFVASTRGARTCTVLAFIAGTGTARGTFNVVGTGIGPHLANPATVPIGDVRVAGAAFRTGTLHLANDGELPMNISSIISNNPPFTVGTFPATIANGAFADVTITYNPVAQGLQASALTVSTNGTPQPSQTVDATGTGTNAIIAVDDPMFGPTNTVAPGTSATTDIVVTNTAATFRGELTVPSVMITDTSGWFSFAAGLGCTAGSTSCTFSPAVVVKNNPAHVTVVCAPPAAAVGGAQATVTFTSDTDSGGTSISTLQCSTGIRGTDAGPDDGGMDDGGMDDGGGSGPDGGNAFTNPYANQGCASTMPSGFALVLAPIAFVLRRRRRRS